MLKAQWDKLLRNHISTQSQDLAIAVGKISLQWRNLVDTILIKFNIFHDWTIQYYAPTNVMHWAHNIISAKHDHEINLIMKKQSDKSCWTRLLKNAAVTKYHNTYTHPCPDREPTYIREDKRNMAINTMHDSWFLDFGSQREKKREKKNWGQL